MNEIRTLTVDGKTYDCFQDLVARGSIAGLHTRIDHIEAGGVGGTTEYNRVSVRDYGAVGDGDADDRQAIIDAFTAAKSMLPCEVYFPAGTYGISNGIQIEMAYGTGGLLVRGAGRDITQIKYLESYDPRQEGVSWYAIRIWPDGMQKKPKVLPPTENEWLHDISITGLTVYDTDPCAHAIHPDKGDTSKEETHGFDIQFCKRVSVTDCNIITVGDEAIDICSCHDVVVMNNHVVGSPGAGSAGGAISIGDGSKGVVVANNTINGTAEDETLDDGTVITKSNFGIAVESLNTPVADVAITGNTITNVRGSGVHFNTPNDGASITNLSIADNIISNCFKSVVCDGTYPKAGLKITGNIISDCAGNAVDMEDFSDVIFCNNTIRNIHGAYAYRGISGSSTQIICNNLFENIGQAAMYVSGKLEVKDCVFKNIFTENRTNAAAIVKYGGTMTVSGCKLINNKSSKGIQNADAVEHTEIELIDADGKANNGGDALSGTATKRIIGGVFGGRVKISQPNAIVNGLTITSTNIGNHALQIAANGVSVIGCNIDITAKDAINENSGYNGSLIMGNIVNRPITTVGANTVAVNNVDLRNLTA